MKYNYIIFSTSYSRQGIIDKNEFYAVSLRDLENLNNVQVVLQPLEHFNYLINRLYRMTLSLNKRHNIDFRYLWYPYFFSSRFDMSEKVCVICASSEIPIGFFRFLRKRYKNIKLVRVFCDLVSVNEKVNKEYTLDNKKDLFDYLMTYDKGEASKYGMLYYEPMQSKIDVVISNKYPSADVFFAGKAKNRLSKLFKIYEKLSALGLRCEYYLLDVPKNEQLQLPGVIYGDRIIPYVDMLYKSVNSRIILDVNQNDAIGYNARYREAIMYNKLLLTDNIEIEQSKYYKPEYIHCFKDVDSINPDWFKNLDRKVDYDYSNEFSPIHLIEQIENIIVNGE